MATSPLPTGSPTMSMTIGIVLVAFRAASAAGVVSAAMTSTFRRTNSVARSGSRSRFPGGRGSGQPVSSPDGIRVTLTAPGGHVETKNAYKSFRFKNSLVWNTGLRARTSPPGKPEMEVGSPTEFKGDPGVWSPEELLVCALNACLMLTFVSWAQKQRATGCGL